MKKYLLEMLEYDLWANERVYMSLSDFIQPPEKALELFSHIIISQIIWYDRILGNTAQYKSPWQIINFEESKTLLVKINGDLKSILEMSDILEKEVEYKNTKGVRFVNSASDILTHIINHSTYHRGQIASIVRKEGGTPAVTDYIAFKR